MPIAHTQRQIIAKANIWQRFGLDTNIAFQCNEKSEISARIKFFGAKLKIFLAISQHYSQRSSTSLILKVFSDSAPVLFIYLFLGVVSFFSLTFFLKFSFICLQPSSYRPLQRFLLCLKFSISILSLF
jgi:hypothetical protein